MSQDAMAGKVRDYQMRVQAVLHRVLPSAETIPQRLHAAQRYAVLGGGKRLRPLLVYCTGEALDLPLSAFDAPAAAVELIHTYSLVHDDLPAMDDDDLRRGQPTTHRAFDEATAILAGDALQVLAFSLLARERAVGVSAEARLKMIQILADASGTLGMAGGQAIDLGAVGRHLVLEELESMHRLKTGALIRASVLLGAAGSSSLTAVEWDALDGYAQDIGLAFQIQDDILDVEGTVQDLGKAIGADAARDKPTYPSIMGLDAAKARAASLKLRACERLQPLGERARVLAWLASYVIEKARLGAPARRIDLRFAVSAPCGSHRLSYGIDNECSRPHEKPAAIAIEDVQGHADLRHIPINEVGIKDILHPVTVEDRAHGKQHTVASCKMVVNLPHSFKGTHMSRFVELLHRSEGSISVESFGRMLRDMTERLAATSGHIAMTFPFFVMKKAPVSGVASLMNYQATISGEHSDGKTEVWLKVVVPTTSLCPCSKEISDYGAHNQRSHITLTARLAEHMWLEELIEIAEREASCEVYGILKRPDEKYVTERAYDNPKFVEDTVRDLAAAMNRDTRVRAYRVESENFESIHNHSAYAMIDFDKDKDV